MVTIDITSGLYDIHVHQNDQKYLGFQWGQKYFIWKCIPFGLNGSTYFFYKTIRTVTVTKHLQKQCIRVVAGVKYFIVMSPMEKINSDSHIVLKLLNRSE